MKKLLLSAMVTTLAMTSLAASPLKVTDHGQKFSARESLRPAATFGFKAPARADEVTVYDLLGAPEGTVFAGPYNENAWYTGSQTADLGRPDYGCHFFQHISNNYYKFDGIRFFGFFKYFDPEEYNWYFCDSRGGMNEDGELTEPIKFEISVFKEGADGYPGECIYKRIVDIKGEHSGVEQGDESEGYQAIYKFDYKFEEELALETGYIQVCAADNGDAPSCWFTLLTANSSVDFGYNDNGDGTYSYTILPMVFYLTGSGQMAAHKALDFNRLLSPASNANGPFERVQVEVLNAGDQPLDNGRLQLWAYGKMIAEEDIDATIPSLGTYKHTFEARIDCTTPGTNRYEIRNSTPGDEGLCSPVARFSIETEAAGKAGASYGEDFSRMYITNVTFGNIDNTTEGTAYSDFTDMKATLRPGETMLLTVTPSMTYFPTAAWIDWNGNGILGEEDEYYLISKDADFTVEIKIPDDLVITDGDKLMRVIASPDIYGGSQKPVGAYDNGETEDYTITVAHAKMAPVMKFDIAEINETLNSDAREISFKLANEGVSQLTGAVSHTYILPNTPSNRFSTAEPIVVAPENAPARRALSSADRAKAPRADETTAYTVRYDNGQYDAIGITNSPNPVYAHLYPGKMLESLNGMKLSSVDIYIPETCGSSKLVVYGENTQSGAGALIVDQAFKPVPDSWNHIVLDNPVTIDGKDLWVGLQVSDFGTAQYHIGIDYGPATIGFGDVTNIGGEMWWSMADLGINSNFCIRANVTGEATPAISWMNIDKDYIDLYPQTDATYRVNLDASRLENNHLYEAVIDLTSNDALAKKVTIPVYVVNGEVAAIGEINAVADITIEGSVVTVNGDDIASMGLYSLTGSMVKLVSGQRFSADSIEAGVYILVINHSNGTRESVKLILGR